MSFKNYLINLCTPQLRIPILFYLKKITRTLYNEINYLEDLVPKNKVAIDIGANKGGKINNFLFKTTKNN